MLDGPGAFRGRTFNDGTFSYPMYRDFRDRNTVFGGVVARFPTPLTMLDDDQAERVNGELVTGNYFDVLGVRRALGRTFTPGRRPHARADIRWRCSATTSGCGASRAIRAWSTARSALNGHADDDRRRRAGRLLRHRRRREPRRHGAGDDEGADDADLGRPAEPRAAAG